jgi:hypothetical protein
MSGIFVVAWEQSGAFNLAAVVIANDEQQALEAIHMYQPENIRCYMIGQAEKQVSSAVVVCQESL